MAFESIRAYAVSSGPENALQSLALISQGALCIFPDGRPKCFYCLVSAVDLQNTENLYMPMWT